MEHWDLPSEIKALAEHIAASVSTSAGSNRLWHYFGLLQAAEPAPPGSTEEKLQLLSRELKELRSQIQSSSGLLRFKPKPDTGMAAFFESNVIAKTNIVEQAAAAVGIPLISSTFNAGTWHIIVRGTTPRPMLALFANTLAGASVPFTLQNGERYADPD